MRRRASVLVLVAGAALALAAVAYAGNAGFAPVTPHSPNASRINDAYKLIGLLTGIIFLVVEGALVFFVVKYRRGRRPRTVEGPQVHGATRLELIWTALPVLIVAGIAAFVLYKLPGIRDVPAAKAQGGPVAVRVDAHQFYWQFTYPNGATSINDLHVPVDRVVTLEIHSQDVAHSWWIPSLGGKFDAIPGRTNHTWFQTSRMGTYVGQCGEFCGTYHASMIARVVAVSPSAYDSYLASAHTPATLGRAEWTGVCAQCHGLAGQGGYGPNIQANPVLTSPAGLRTLLLKGQNQLPPTSSYMPPVGRGWTQTQFAALQAYIKAHIAKGATSGG